LGADGGLGPQAESVRIATRRRRERLIREAQRPIEGPREEARVDLGIAILGLRHADGAELRSG